MVIHRSDTFPMVALPMLRPWKHPKTGVLWFRAAVPKSLRAVAGKQLVTWTLSTKEPKEAREAWPSHLERWEAMKAGWRGEPDTKVLTPDEAKTLALQWAQRVARGQLKLRHGSALGPTPDKGGRVSLFNEYLTHRHIPEALNGSKVTPESMEALKAELWPLAAEAYRAAFLAESSLSGSKAPPLTLDHLFDAWATLTTSKARTVADTKGQIRALREFLGRSEAAKVSKADIVRWRSSMLAEGRSKVTVNTRLALVSSVFQQAVADGKLEVNPVQGTRIAKAQAEQEHYRPYSDTEAATILQAARGETLAHLRWPSWIMAYTGLRIGEVLQLTRADIGTDADTGIPVIRVTVDKAAGKSVKNGKPRVVPVHEALVAEGFLQFVSGLPAEGDPGLFSDSLDYLGRRGGGLRMAVTGWVRDTVGIRNPATAPSHSWRHRIADEFRTAGVAEDVRDALLGHTRPGVGKVYGVRGESLRRLYDDGIARVPRVTVG